MPFFLLYRWRVLQKAGRDTGAFIRKELPVDALAIVVAAGGGIMTGESTLAKIMSAVGFVAALVVAAFLIYWLLAPSRLAAGQALTIRNQRTDDDRFEKFSAKLKDQKDREVRSNAETHQRIAQAQLAPLRREIEATRQELDRKKTEEYQQAIPRRYLEGRLADINTHITAGEDLQNEPEPNWHAETMTEFSGLVGSFSGPSYEVRVKAWWIGSWNAVPKDYRHLLDRHQPVDPTFFDELLPTDQFKRVTARVTRRIKCLEEAAKQIQAEVDGLPRE